MAELTRHRHNYRTNRNTEKKIATADISIVGGVSAPSLPSHPQYENFRIRLAVEQDGDVDYVYALTFNREEAEKLHTNLSRLLEQGTPPDGRAEETACVAGS